MKKRQKHVANQPRIITRARLILFKTYAGLMLNNMTILNPEVLASNPGCSCSKKSVSKCCLIDTITHGNN